MNKLKIWTNIPRVLPPYHLLCAQQTQEIDYQQGYYGSPPIVTS